MPASGVESGSGSGLRAPEFLQDTPLAITVVLLFLLNLLLLPGLAFLALLGVLRLSKAMAGQCYRYLLLGPTED